MRTTDFKPMLPKLVEARFPSVDGFRVDHMAENVRPVEYEDGRGHKANEWPPVARWRVGAERYSYVLKPAFKAERWQITPFFGGTTVRADYSAEDDKLWNEWFRRGVATHIKLQTFLSANAVSLSQRYRLEPPLTTRASPARTTHCIMPVKCDYSDRLLGSER